MDSLTQAVLGAAVAEAVLGPKVGRKAAAWGALAGTLPDLDILAYPFLDTAGELYFHRGITHGIAFPLVVGPLLGWLVWRLYRRRGSPAAEPGWRGWSWLFFWGLLTHPLLDVFTVYGTQLLAPFSNTPFAVGSLFIIDPLVTLPLLGFLLAALWARPAWRRRWALIGLAWCGLYIGWGLVAQQLAHERVEVAAAELGLTPERTIVVAGPLTSLLWRAEIEAEGRVHALTVPLLGEAGRAWSEPPVPLALPQARPGDPLVDSRGGQALQWFSRGWLVLPDSTARPAERGHGLDAQPAALVADARFGRGPDGAFVFAWRLGPDGTLEQAPFGARLGGEVFAAIARRAFGLAAPPRIRPGVYVPFGAVPNPAD